MSIGTPTDRYAATIGMTKLYQSRRASNWTCFTKSRRSTVPSRQAQPKILTLEWVTISSSSSKFLFQQVKNIAKYENETVLELYADLESLVHIHSFGN